MKQLAFASIIMIVGAVNLFAQSTETVKNYFDVYKTQLSEKYTVISGTNTMHGLYQSYNQNGDIIKTVNYKNGKRHGSVKHYNSVTLDLEYSGTFNEGEPVEETGYFRKDQKKFYKKADGVWKIWHESGQLAVEAFIDQGKWGAGNDYSPNLMDYYMVSPSGDLIYPKTIKFFHENGSISAENSFGADGLSSSYVSYDIDGSVIYKREKQGDRGYTETYFQNSSPLVSRSLLLIPSKEEYSPFESLLDGEYVIYNSTGEKVGGGTYVNGKREGEWKYFLDEKGNLCSLLDENGERFLVHGEPHYYRTVQYKNGIPEKVIVYTIQNEKTWEGSMLTDFPDKLHGECKTYQNNKVIAINNYNSGIEHGEQSYFYPSGKLKIRKTQNNGKSIKVEAWFESGQQSQLVVYRDDDNVYESQLWYENGNIKESGLLSGDSPDKKIGIWRFYSESGDLIEVKEYNQYGSVIKTYNGQDYLKQEEQKLKQEQEKVEREEQNKKMRHYDNNIYVIYGKKVASSPRKGGLKDQVEEAYVEIVQPDIPITKIKKKRLYKAYEILFEYLEDISKTVDSDLDAAISATDAMVSLCNKMLQLINEDTDELEDKLKKEKDPLVIAELLEIKI